MFLNISFSGSSLRGPISNAIIKLNEEGYISNLKDQWWKKERGGGTCAVGFGYFKQNFPYSFGTYLFTLIRMDFFLFSGGRK